MLQSMVLKRVGHNWVTKQEQNLEFYILQNVSLKKKVGEFMHEMIEHIGQILDSLEKMTNHCLYR